MSKEKHLKLMMLFPGVYAWMVTNKLLPTTVNLKATSKKSTGCATLISNTLRFIHTKAYKQIHQIILYNTTQPKKNFSREDKGRPIFEEETKINLYLFCSVFTLSSAM
jgi:hypothetical protein